MTVGRVSNFTFGNGAKPKGKGPVGYARGGKITVVDSYPATDWKEDSRPSEAKIYEDRAAAKLKAAEDRLIDLENSLKNIDSMRDRLRKTEEIPQFKRGGKVKKGKR